MFYYIVVNIIIIKYKSVFVVIVVDVIIVA